jgi:AraC-like DNA-binding protein
MKLQLENIRPDTDSSFHLMLNPRLSNFFFWHFHPEFELVYIEGTDGTRHVGSHISRYEGSDLVFIGSNIPHLNFDYGVKGDYEKIVLHIQPDFLQGVLEKTPELRHIHQFLQQSAHGIAIHGATKQKAASMLKSLAQLPPFQQFIHVLNLLELLALSDETLLLHDKPVETRPHARTQDRLQRIYHLVDENYQRKIEVAEAARLCHMTNAAFCRYFKQWTRLSFVDFLHHYRISIAQRKLLAAETVSDACYASGFDSLSYFNRIFKKVVGESPSAFRRRHL